MEMEKTPVQDHIEGVIVRVRLDGPDRYFTLMTTDNRIIRVPLDERWIEDRRDELLDYLKKRTIIGVDGRLVAHERGAVMEDLVDIGEGKDKIEITELEEQPLAIPIPGRISYEEFEDRDFWVISNDELNAYGVGETLDKAKQSFLESLMASIELFADAPDQELAPKALELKKILRRHLGRE